MSLFPLREGGGRDLFLPRPGSKKQIQKKEMIGLIWNCRGVNKKGLSTYLKEVISEHQIDLIGLQETMKKSYDDKFFRKVDPNKAFAWQWIPSSGRSRGILCGIKLDTFDVINFEVKDFSIIAHVFDKKRREDLCLVIVYGPAHDENKEQFLTELAQICAARKAPMLIGGDFNILRFSSEKKFLGNRYTDMFNLVISAYELRNLPLIGGKYTWSVIISRTQPLRSWIEF